MILAVQNPFLICARVHRLLTRQSEGRQKERLTTPMDVFRIAANFCAELFVGAGGVDFCGEKERLLQEGFAGSLKFIFSQGIGVLAKAMRFSSVFIAFFQVLAHQAWSATYTFQPDRQSEYHRDAYDPQSGSTYIPLESKDETGPVTTVIGTFDRTGRLRKVVHLLDLIPSLSGGESIEKMRVDPEGNVWVVLQRLTTRKIRSDDDVFDYFIFIMTPDGALSPKYSALQGKMISQDSGRRSRYVKDFRLAENGFYLILAIDRDTGSFTEVLKWDLQGRKDKQFGNGGRVLLGPQAFRRLAKISALDSPNTPSYRGRWTDLEPVEVKVFPDGRIAILMAVNETMDDRGDELFTEVHFLRTNQLLKQLENSKAPVGPPIATPGPQFNDDESRYYTLMHLDKTGHPLGFSRLIFSATAEDETSELTERAALIDPHHLVVVEHANPKILVRTYDLKTGLQTSFGKSEVEVPSPAISLVQSNGENVRFHLTQIDESTPGQPTAFVLGEVSDKTEISVHARIDCSQL